MRRTFEFGAVATAPAAPASPSHGHPTNGDPGTGTPATTPGAHWYGMVTDEIQNVVEGAGITPSHTDHTQLYQAILALASAQMPPGFVAPFAGATAPAGWLECNGAAVSRTTYAALFAAIGTIHGVGDGATTFNLPDTRGEFIRGHDHGRGVDAGRVLGSAQSDSIKAHSHKLPIGDASGTASVPYGIATGEPAHDVEDFTAAHAGATIRLLSAEEGGTETRPRNVAMMYCIKF